MEVQCLDKLGRVLDMPNATWVSWEQKDAMMTIMKHKTDVLAMLKTGGGKSMLAIIAAMMEPKSAIIVVLPLRSLMADWKRKLEEMKIRHQVYDPRINGGRLETNINLVLVSADQAMHGGWRKSLAELNETLAVTRMVFDEAHLVLLSDDFRDSLVNVAELRQLKMQLILLSGTIPPSSVAALKERFGLLETTKEIRQCSNRPELEYILERPLGLIAMSSRIEEIVSKERENWSSQDRGLVFVTYLEDGHMLAAQVSMVMLY